MRKILAILLFLLGLYLPTSFHYQIHGNVAGMYGVILCLILLVWILIQRNVPKSIFFTVLAINIVLLISTALTPFSQYTFGALVPFVGFSLLFCLKLKELTFGKRVFKLFMVINALNILLGILIVFDNSFVNEVFLKNYAAYYENLLPNMLYDNKPVLFFSSHSRAAFHLFLFFFMTYVAYKHTKNRVYLLFSFCYIFLIFHLGSNTSYMFLAISVLILGSYLIKYKFKGILFSAILLSLAGLFNLQKIIGSLQDMRLQFSNTLFSQRNGFLGRYSENGQLAENIRFMKGNLFRPVGLGYSDDLFFSDSGMILYTLRGTIILTLLIYFGLYTFLKRNLKHKYHVLILFLAIFLMDLGSPALTYFRTLYLIPFVLVFLNSISTLEEEGKTVPRRSIRVVWSK